jgi:serine/threonine protein kinase
MLSADTVVKVGDFGMARDVYETEYYRKEGRGFLPVRWMAPESIRDGKFTSQSDVWSYGVVLWEMATLAEVPYQGLANEQVMSYVKEGRKMHRPENCPDILFSMMSECWEVHANARPTFLDICKKLLPDASEEFKKTAFYLSSEGQDAVLNQEQMQQMRREQEEAACTDPQTPLTAPQQQQQTNGSNGVPENNGHLPASGDSMAMVVIRPGTSRSPTHVQFSNEQGQGGGGSSRTSKLSGILGEIQRLRNKSGSTSGEA